MQVQFRYKIVGGEWDEWCTINSQVTGDYNAAVRVLLKEWAKGEAQPPILTIRIGNMLRQWRAKVETP